uniref:Reverse transcriptase domain-containing protein n=1 Tax=Phytophthora ramorum TaxID=164328 RepID=H3H0K0_PHYRM
MPGMVDYEYDAEGDVRMTVPQPIFEVVAAPELAVWSQAAITTFIRERRQYEAKIAERCSTTGEVQETVARSIRTSLKPRVLEHVAHYILKKEVETPEEELLLGKSTLQSIGVDLDGVFEQLAQQHIEAAEFEADDIPCEHMDVLGNSEDNEVDTLLHNMVDEAIQAGFEPAMADELRQMVLEYSDVFRVRLGRDEAADVQPLEVRLESGVQPYRSGVRRYPEAQRQFLREYVRELEDAGLVERNTQSRWACPALPVAKRGTDEFRITIDYRPVNRLTVPLAGAAPNLRSPRELFSFVTEDGVFTPSRVPQGACDSAVHFQAQMHEVLRDLLFRNVLVWIDDVLLYACTAGAFLESLGKFFAILRQRKLKLNARKCKLFAKRVKWCGKVIDGAGVEHDPERLAALRQMPLPPTGAALQHFLCALNWLRDSMVDYARTTAPLQEKLERVMQSHGRRKAQLSGAVVEWSKEEAETFRKTLEMIERSCKLAFPDKRATVCLFSDASLTGYALVLTQVLNWQDGVPVEEQQHELLICRGGLFKNAQRNWSIVEKEGYPIVKACGDLDYMLTREKGFHVYCDHSNLIQIFTPDREVKQHVKGKLQRWALKLSSLWPLSE